MKILLAVDGSRPSNRAVSYLVLHIGMFGRGGSITLLYVDPPMLPRIEGYLGNEVVVGMHAKNVQAALRPAVARLRRAGIAHRTDSRIGDPGTAIAEYARAGKYDIVVMGSHGHGMLGSLLLGSVTTRVLAYCRVPVLVVR